MRIDSNSIGKNIAKALCHQLDFPRLVNRAYNDNIRIFIEVGVGSNCSRWISEILKDKEHLAVSLNRRGVDDHTSIIKALAKLSRLNFKSLSRSSKLIRLLRPIPKATLS